MFTLNSNFLFTCAFHLLVNLLNLEHEIKAAYWLLLFPFKPKTTWFKCKFYLTSTRRMNYSRYTPFCEWKLLIENIRLDNCKRIMGQNYSQKNWWNQLFNKCIYFCDRIQRRSIVLIKLKALFTRMCSQTERKSKSLPDTITLLYR